MKLQQDKNNSSQTPLFRQTRSIILISLITCIVFLLIGCGTQATPQSQAGITKTVVMSSSWAEYYKTLKDLKSHTNLAVQGTFTGILRTVVDPKDQVFTDFSFSIANVAYSHKLLSASVITIRQEGGLYKNTSYQESDDPSFQVGEQSFLFLREVSSNLYVVAGGPSGRFIVQNGSVKPIAKDAVQLPSSTNVSSFTSTVQKT